MTEGLKVLLEYQEVDREVYRVDTEFRRSRETQVVAKLQNEIQTISQTIYKMDKEAADLMSSLERWEKEVDDLPADEIRTKIAACNTLEQLSTYEKQLNKYNDIYTSLQKEIARASKRLKEIYEEVRRLNERGRKMQEEYQKAYIVYRQKMAEMQQQLQPQKEKLDALKAKIPEKLFAAYKARRDQRKFPPFVQYKKGNCAGCGMDISAEVASKLKAVGDLAECPSCHRVVYLDEE